jgi:arsenite methyltransferase
LAVSDVVLRGEVPAEIRKSMELWVGCIAGALQQTEYVEKLDAVGFDGIEVEPTRVYQVEEAREFLEAAGFDAEKIGPQIKDKFMSAFLRASKPIGMPCCGTDCCN